MFPEFGQLQMIHTTMSRARHDIFRAALYQTHTPEEVKTVLSREHEAAELTGQAPDLAGPRGEQVESDFFGDGNVADES